MNLIQLIDYIIALRARIAMLEGLLDETQPHLSWPSPLAYRIATALIRSDADG